VNIIDIEKRNQFTRKLEQTLRQFEPRFKSVKISFLDNSDNNDRTLRFRIDAVIYADPLPEVVVFDSVLESVTRTVNVKEVSHG
jgi:type VI secretion system protein ImpF